MIRIEFLKYVSICATAAAVTLGLYHAMHKDLLLLATDIPTLSVYLGSMVIALTAVAMILLSPYWMLNAAARGRARSAVLLILSAAILVVIVQALLGLATLSGLMKIYRDVVGSDTRQWLKDFVLAHIAGIELFFFLVCLWLTRNAAAMHRRVGMLGGILLIAALVGLVMGKVLLAQSIAPVQAGIKRQVVLIVLDGMGADVVQSMDPDVLARMHPDATLKAVTALPYTSGFFGVLYGSLPCDTGQPGLLRLMQKKAVATRWFSFHENGFPDTSGCHVTNYRGLRSKVLTPVSAFVPRLLGLDYNLVITANDSSAPETVTHVLLPELKDLFQHSRRALAIIHLRASPNSLAAFDETKSGDERAMLLHGVRQNEYTYPPALEPIVAAERKRFVHGAQTVLGNMGRLIAGLRADPNSADAIILVTADHGTAFAHGHMYYGYHVDKAVRETPLLVFGHVEALPSPDALLWTPDLPVSLASLLGASSQDMPGQNIFAAGAGRGEVATLGIRAPTRHRYLLAITTAHGTSTFNIDPDGDGKMVRQTGGEPAVMQLTQTPTPAEVAKVKAWLRRYHIAPATVHPIYRDRAPA